MKKLLLVAFCLTSICAVHAQDNPGEYMSAISRQQQNLNKRYMSYISASAHGKREKKVEALRVKLIDEIQEARMNVSGLGAFKGDKSYRDTMVNFYKLYYNIMNDDYSKIINMEEIAEKSYDAMETYLLAEEKVSEKLAEGNEKVRLAQKDFAARNNVNLIEGTSELGNKIAESNKVSKYYHQIYLVFFKPYVQSKFLSEAIKQNNLTAIEQSRSYMKSYAEEGLAKLATMKGYDGDGSLLVAARELMKYYVKDAGNAAIAGDYFLAKEKFAAVKKEMDKKSNRTQADVDAYNKEVNASNAMTGKFNAAMKQSFEDHNEKLKEWEKVKRSFFDEHTPTYK